MKQFLIRLLIFLLVLLLLTYVKPVAAPELWAFICAWIFDPLLMKLL